MATSYSQMLGLPAPPVTQVRSVCLPLLLLSRCAAPRIRALMHCSTRGNPRQDVLNAHALLFPRLCNAPLPCPGAGGRRGQPHLLRAVPAPQRHQGGRLLWYAASPVLPCNAAASPPTRTRSLSGSGEGVSLLKRPITAGLHVAGPSVQTSTSFPPASQPMQVPIMQSDLSFSLLYGSNLPEALIRAVPALLAEFPAGLLTPAGTTCCVQIDA